MSTIALKYFKIEKLLEQIRDFGHSKDCCSSATIYECGCYKKDQSDLADQALQILKRIGWKQCGKISGNDYRPLTTKYNKYAVI